MTLGRYLCLQKNLNGVKKAILTYNKYEILAVVDLNKTENWKNVKGKSIWTNTQFKSHEEKNNNSHLCFPFTVKS